MKNQKLSLSIPPKWQEKFLIRRFDEEEIEISLEERNIILKALNDGARFIQIGKYTLMLNAIKSIDPKWGKYNTPPRPEVRQDYLGVSEMGMVRHADNKKDKAEAELWDKLFKDKLMEI